MAGHVSSGALPYYVKSGKWLSESVRTFIQREIRTCKNNFSHLIIDGWIWIDEGEITFERLTENLDDLAFSKQDVIEFETRYAVNKREDASAEKEVVKDCETFVRSLRVSYESKSEINIREPKKPARTYNFTALGFKNLNAKTWKTFLEILETPDCSFNIGPAHQGAFDKKQRVKAYDRNRQIIMEIDSRLRTFFEKNFGFKPSKGFRTYELAKNEKAGTYRFKFACSATKYDRASDDEIKEKIISLLQNDLTDAGEELASLFKIALERKILSEEEIKAKVNQAYDSYQGKEDIRPLEN